MGRMKEVFAEHIQEQESIIAEYYAELYKMAGLFGVQEAGLREVINNKKEKENGKRN